jgi:TonB family protein
MHPRAVAALFLTMATLASVGAAADSLFVPGLVGQDIYRTHRALRKLGLASRFERVELDTAEVPLFFVASQVPDSGVAAQPGDTVVLRFNHPGLLRYWNASVVPLMGDFGNTVGFYKVQMPPHPIRVEPAVYPPELKPYTFSGGTDVEALVDFDGSVLAVRVVRSSGYGAADSSACEAALRNSFAPAEDHGQPVRVWFPLPYRFQFKEDRSVPGPVKQGQEPVEP